MDLSIVIPAFKEGTKIRKDVEAAAAFFSETGLSGEIIIVDDGSPDNTAAEARKAQAPAKVPTRVIRYNKNRGKGYAVTTGIKASKGDFVMFADSGLCIPFSYALVGLESIKKGECEIAHATRKHAKSRILAAQRIHRRMGSKVFRRIISFLGVPREVTDSQCGFKIYRGDVARELYSECITEGFIFDVEILIRALKKGYRIIEFPVQWNNDSDTRLRPFQTAFTMIFQLLAIHKALRKEEKSPEMEKEEKLEKREGQTKAP